MSRSTPRNRSLPPDAALQPDPLIAPASLDTTLRFATLFGREAPVEVEIGFGKGRFLLHEAASRPDVSLLGIETALPYVRLVRHLALQRGICNVRLLGGNARDVFARLMPKAALAAIYVLFPDPWPKRRHHGRRLVNAEFLGLAARALAGDGVLHVVTDDPDYAAAIGAVETLVPELVLAPERAFGPELRSRTHFAAKLAERGARFSARAWVRE